LLTFGLFFGVVELTDSWSEIAWWIAVPAGVMLGQFFEIVRDARRQRDEG
jgi:hypothetical protein